MKKQRKNIEIIEIIENMIRDLRGIYEDDFDEKFCEFFKEVISKNPKPCRYLYKQLPWELRVKGFELAFIDSEQHNFTKKEKIDSAEGFYTSRNHREHKLSEYSELVCPVIRCSLYKVELELMEKHFNCNSIKMFLKRYGENKTGSYSIEDHFCYQGFQIVHFGDSELFIGVEDTLLEDLVFKLERCEPNLELEFDDDDD